MKEIFEQWAPLIIAAAAIALLVGIITSPTMQEFITKQFEGLITTTINTGSIGLPFNVG